MKRFKFTNTNNKIATVSKKIMLLLISAISLQIGAQTITNFTTADGLINDAINCVAVDANDNIWLGTSSGISKFDGVNWTTYTTADGLVNDNVKAITATANGNIWVGTDFGVSKFDGVNWTTYTTTDGLAMNQVAHIAQAPNGDLWFAHASFSAGVSRLVGTTWTTYSSPDLPISGVAATAFDANGDKWFATPLDGTVHYDGTTFTTYTINNGLVSNYSTAILCDNNQKWIGTSSGMSVLDATNTSVTNHTQMYILPPPDTLNPVVDIAQDGFGRIWTTIYVGYLAEGGVAFWNGTKWEDFDVSDGLAGPNVRELAIDSDDNVWVATSTGLSKIVSIPSSFEELINNKQQNSTKKLISVIDFLGRKTKNTNQIQLYIYEDGTVEKIIFVE